MRATIAILVVSLAALTAPSALGDGFCLPRCEVGGTTWAVVPAAALVESGSSVTWRELDGMVHTATSAADWCFSTLYGPGAPSEVALRIADGILYAKTPDRSEKACTAATALPDGSFLVDYVCAFHPMMDGKLLVTPEATP